jgi:DNA helicase II / ATP-dependent DNA helicase PcrA
LISWQQFLDSARTTLGRDLSHNQSQRAAVEAPADTPLYIVAGPGSGKTTVLVLRILKLIYVDGQPPESIVATTFTRLAAEQLRSRILGWGDQLKSVFLPLVDAQTRSVLESLDLNRIETGTLDSIAEEVMADNRAPGSQPPVVIEEFIANGFMLRHGIFSHGRQNNGDLRGYAEILYGSSYGLTAGRIAGVCREIRDRIYHDSVDVNQYATHARPDGSPPHPGTQVILSAINDYDIALRDGLLVDFAELEHMFLSRLRDGSLQGFLDGIRFLFVDEYQDSNLLQESVYFEMAQGAIQRGGAMTVVGDDDQSLYRFRGATIDLFQAFPTRFAARFPMTPATAYLSENYRSTASVVTFCRDFALIDTTYQAHRVPNKPPIVHARAGPQDNLPILGMFRADAATLAHDLSSWLAEVVTGTGAQVHLANGQVQIVHVDPNGSAADCVLLCSSPREFGSTGNPRLPLLLRQELRGLANPIEVFNPRGQELNSVPSVQLLCGLMLECLDPNQAVEQSIQRLPQVARNRFNGWRAVAGQETSINQQLAQFVTSWQNRTPLRRQDWEREIHLNDLSYKLVTWIPVMQDDIEGLVYLEAVTRVINDAGASGLSSFRSRIVRDLANPGLEQASIREALWNIFVPIATGAIDVNEDLFETLPRDRLAVLSIHQAKGLEFPLVIVDVGSDFTRNYAAQRFKRFPTDGGYTGRLEDELLPWSPLGAPPRSAIDRAFDDLIRQYFVSFSRAQDVLLLVGTDAVRNRIQNVACGWDRLGNWTWGQGLNNLTHL